MKYFAILVIACMFADASAFPASTYPKNPDLDIQHYRFELTLTDESDEIKGNATITALLKKAGMNSFDLDLTSMNAAGKGMRVSAVSAPDGAAVNFTHNAGRLTINLPSASTAGQTVVFVIAYSGVPATGLQMKPNKFNHRTFFSDNWPDLTRNWLPAVDHPSDKASCEFIITAPSHYQVISNGLKIEQTNLSTTQTRTHWTEAVPIAPWLYVLGVAEFAVQYVDTFDGKSIETWVFPENRDEGFRDFASPTKQVLEFYTKYVGPFAYEKLANIQASSVAGGMESASAILYNEKCVTGDGSWRWKAVVIHEIAHQWFGDAVTEADWDDVWLSEGFATYFTALFIEHAYGRDEFVKEMQSARNRVFEFYKTDPTHTVIHNNLSDMSKVTSAHTYQKGAWMLHMLRTKIGNEAFKNGIQRYYKRFMNGNASTADFQFEMEQAGNTDLSDFFQQWLRQGGKLTLAADWKYKSGAVVVNLSQTQKDANFSMPVEIGIFKKGQAMPEIRQIILSEKKATASFPFDEQPERVVIDPRTVLLAEWNIEKK